MDIANIQKMQRSVAWPTIRLSTKGDVPTTIRVPKAEEGLFAVRASTALSKTLSLRLPERIHCTNSRACRERTRRSVIQGGTGAIGQVVAKMMADDSFCKLRTIVLTSRSGRSGEGKKGVANSSLANRDTLVSTMRTDAASGEQARLAVK